MAQTKPRTWTPEQWYFDNSDRVRQMIADAGVELELYCSDLEAVSYTMRPERNAEYLALVRWLCAQRRTP